MARSKGVESAENYDRILAAATEIIETEGAARLSLRRVAERSDTSLGAVTYYFENRGTLLEACLERTFNLIASLVITSATRIAEGAPWQTEVDTFVRSLFRTTRVHRQQIRMRILTTLEGGSVPRRRFEQQLLPMLDKTALVFAGSSKATSVRLAAYAVEVIVTRYALHTDEELMSIAGTTDLKQTLEHVETHLVGLCTAAFATALRAA